MDIQTERSYPTPLSNSTLLPLLLLSLTKQRHTPHTSATVKHEYDYIVVGGGAAGPVVASRLSENPFVSVLLLEAGPEPPLLTEVPSFASSFLGTDVDWQFQTVPQKHAASGLINRQIAWASGKMLGGSGNHNGMAYVRGNKKDYDDWAAQGAKGWSYDDVLPYFLKLEDYRAAPTFTAGYHAIGGPITVEQPAYKYYPKIKEAVIEAATDLGYPFVDSNADRQTGFFNLELNTRDGQRCSSPKGYLVPAENRTNLDILVNAMVTKVIIDDGQATGVVYFHKDQFKTVKSRAEVVLSAGTVNTPKILMLSGIGPKEDLHKLNIPVIADLPVGKNFHDHAKSLHFSLLNPLSESLEAKLSNPINVMKYINSRSGPLIQPTLLEAFLNGQSVRPVVDYPNHCLQFGERSGKYMKKLGLTPEVYNQFLSPYKDNPIFVCTVQHLRPKSRGTVSLNSSNPFEPPLIDPNYLEHPSDLEDLVDALKVCKRVMAADPVVNLGVRPLETLVPGCEIHAKSDNAYFSCYARKILFTNYHAVGTCKMGDPQDPSTVVDPELRVKNIKSLRVVDASIMPMIPSGNINIPTIMVAEKASDLIKGLQLP